MRLTATDWAPALQSHEISNTSLTTFSSLRVSSLPIILETGARRNMGRQH